MTDDRIGGYAAGILSIARAEGDPERVSNELFRVARSIEESHELRDALTDPRLPAERKSGIINDLLGERSSPLVTGLVAFIVNSGRGPELAAIVDRLAEQAAAERGRAVAEVRSAIELDDGTVSRLEEALSRATGRTVEARVIVDPTVLGGVRARIGDTIIDGTVRGRLESLREKIEV